MSRFRVVSCIQSSTEWSVWGSVRALRASLIPTASSEMFWTNTDRYWTWSLCSPSGIQSPPRKCLGVTLCFCAPPGWQRCSSTTLQSHWTRDQEVCLRADQGEWQYKWERLGLLKVHPVVVTAAHWTFWWITDSGFNVDGKNVISIHTMSFSSLREPQAGEDGGVGLVPGPIPIPWIPDIFKWAGQSAVPFHVYDFLNVILTICKYLLGTWLVCSFYML